MSELKWIELTNDSFYLFIFIHLFWLANIWEVDKRFKRNCFSWLSADDQKLLELREEVLPEQMEWRSINQEEPEPLKCKEEEEEVSIKQEENDIIAVIVNSEEELDSQFLQLHQSQAEENRKDSGLNRCLRPWVEDESDESSETEDSEDDWKETTEGSTPKTVKHKRASINVNNGKKLVCIEFSA